jgi:hypothetical protein
MSERFDSVIEIGFCKAAAEPVKDQVFRLMDGFYCIVDGRTYGTWETKELAEAGMQVEQRRAKARTTWQ